MAILPAFKNNIITLYGDEGRDWLEKLPHFIKSLEDKWGLAKLTPIPTSIFHCVMTGVGQGQPIVLKVGFDQKGLAREARALRCFQGYGAVRLLDAEEGALLLERVLPGKSLVSYFHLDDRDAIEISCLLMQKLHSAPLPEKGTFMTLREKLELLDHSWNMPITILNRARKLRDKLLDTCTAPVLLHGDLHHDNILRYGHHHDDWIAIDPKGLIGEACYDIPAFIRNPMPQLMKTPEANDIVAKRIEYFSELTSYDSYRIIAWSYVQAVMAWCWSLEDMVDPWYFKKLVPLFSDMLD